MTLLGDVADCGSITISKNITLEGNGHTISGNSSINVNMPGNADADVTIHKVIFKDIANGNKLSAFYFSQVKGKLTITNCTFDSIEYEAIQVTPAPGAVINISNNMFKAKADGSQIRHIHIEMAYGSGFDYEGENINLTVTDNQLHGTVSGDASMGIWWVGTDSTLKVDGNYMEHPETVSITLTNSGVRYNRGDLIYPARSNANVDVDDLMPVAIVAEQAGGESKIHAYNTLAEAIAAAKDGDAIKLLADCSGDGIVVKGDTFPNGLTIDFAGHSYTVGGKLVGSAGTASNGFQLLKGNTIVMRNGFIYGDASVAGDDTTQWSGSPAIMIQNYSNLTLDGMTVKGGKQTCYTLSNNNGDTVIKDSTIIAGQNTQVGGPFAFDVCRYASYPSVSVTVEGNSTIDGCVDVSGNIGEGQSRQLTITGGTFNKPISVSTQPANIAIGGGTFASAVPDDYCAAGFTPTVDAEGKYGVKLDEGAYLLQNYRSGEQASWTYPTQDGKAFAGWYKDAALTTPCTADDAEGAAYAKFVKIGDCIQYMGGSLRMDGPAASESTSLRFGYITSVPDDAKYIDSWWTWNDGLTEQEPVHAANRVLFSGGAALANLVVTTLQAEYYTTTFHVTEHLKYQTVDGTTVEVAETTSHQHSAKTVAKAVLDNPGASPEELAYAQQILDTIGKE